MVADFLRIYVLWATASKKSAELAELVSSHFDGLGMERDGRDRDGVAIRIPVRFRSVAWDVKEGMPREIDLTGARHNAVVLLYDGYMEEAAKDWSSYVGVLRAAMAARGDADLYIPFGSPDGAGQLDCDQGTQYGRRDKWSALSGQHSQDARFLLHLVFRLREHLRAAAGNKGTHEPLFVSHAKIDGDDAAQAIINYVNRIDQDVPLRSFYDAKELLPGDDFKDRFVDEINRATLLAIVSDVYDSRPWCVFELTTAKRARRPIVLADVGKVRTGRTYPYGANLPKIRVKAEGDATTWIEELLVETLSEGLRCDLFHAQALAAANAAGIASPLVLPRPPELFDMIEHDLSDSLIIYPDPPLGRLEAELLEKVHGGAARIMTLSEVRPL
jgi:hypothetical protein